MLTTDMEVEIGNLDLVALRKRWRDLFGSEPPPRMSRELTIRAIAYRIQEDTYGALSRTARMRLLSTAAISSTKARVRKDRNAKPGTRFLREWNGRTHEVIATADGRYSYRGAAYRSLSAIAREITGTRWSGPAFFGLNGHGRTRDATE